MKQAALLISGATGNIGSELTKLLSQRGIAFRAMVREPAAAAALAALPGAHSKGTGSPGSSLAQVIAGDFDDPASLDRALAGVERAFLVTPSTAESEARQLAFVAAAQRAGVRHVVKLSQWAADAASPVRFLRYHAVVESALKASGMAYTFLRPNLFMQGLLGFRDMILAKGAFFAPAGTAAISAIDVRDIAAAAAAALTEPGHEGKTYDLTGPAALTHTEMAALLSIAIDRKIAFVDVPEGAMRDALVGLHMPAWQADGLIEDYAHYRHGEAAEVASGVRDATGQAPRSFADFARDYAGVFA